jgi:tetratricopeptide (TPR) repeat protein
MFQTYADWYGQPSSTTKPDEGLFGLGKEFLGQEKNELAVTAFNKVLVINPDYAEAYYELGVNDFYNGGKTKAKDLLTKYIGIGKDQRHIDDAKAILAVMKVAPAKAGPKKPTKKRG